MENQQQQQHQTETTLEEILGMATTWEPGRVGRNREADGTLPGWHEWAQQHPQAQDHEIQICKGRANWAEAHINQQSNNLNNRVSLVSWNILSDTWYRLSRENETTYDHTPAENGVWEGRFPLLLDWFRALKPTLLCLQEVDYKKFDTDLLPALRGMGYDGMIQTPKKQSNTQPCGVATFWDCARFDLKHSHASSRTLVTVLEWKNNNTAATPKQFCVANCHLESSQTQDGADRRARQLNSALQYARTHATPTTPLLVCGDFNTGADSLLHHVLRTRSWHNHSLASAYEHPAAAETLPVNRATYMVPGHHYVIDHVWYTHRQLRLRAVLDALSPEEIVEQLGPLHALDRGFPNACVPSDHVPVGAIWDFLNEDHTETNTSPDQPKEELLSTSLSMERQEQLTREWQELQSQAPPLLPRGQPTPEQIEERQAHAQAVKVWVAANSGSSSEADFVSGLVKKSKKKNPSKPNSRSSSPKPPAV